MITILSSIIALILAYLLYKLKGEKEVLIKKLSEYESKYQGIIDVDKEIKSRRSEFTNQETTLKNQIAELKG